jgi:peptide/nickel transport system substrate-binding protein
VLLGAAMIAAACGGDNKGSSTNTTTAGGGATTTAGGGATTTAGVATTTAATAKGGTVTYALPDKFTSYNNSTADDNLVTNQEVLNQVQPTIANFNDKAEIFYDKNLVDSVDKTSDNPLTEVFKFNAKAVWSDGQPLGCDDFYLQWISQNGKLTTKDDKGNDVTLFQAASTTGWEQVGKIDCSADGKTVTVTYDTPFSDWRALSSNPGLIPAHVVAKGAGLSSAADIRKAYEAKDTATLQKIADYWNTGMKTEKGLDKSVWISGGPYIITDYQPDQSVTLERNTKYWGPPATLDKIVFRIIIDDTAAAQALKNQEVQIIVPQPDPDLLNQLKGVSGLNTTVNGGFTFEHFDFSFLNPLFQDKAVRQAVAYCLPRQDMVDKLIKPLDANAKVMQNRIFFPFQKDYVDNSGGLYDKVDIAKAKSTLEADGWKLNGSVYEKNGQKLEFKLMHKNNPRRSSEAQLTAASCAQAGISVVDDGDDKWSSRLGLGQFDSVVFAWIGSPLLSTQKPLYHTPPSKENLLSNGGYYSNPQVDKLMDTLTTETDTTKLATAANQADKMMWDDLATVPLFQFVDIVSHTNKVSGVVYNPTLFSQTWNDQTWGVAA